MPNFDDDVSSEVNNNKMEIEDFYYDEGIYDQQTRENNIIINKHTINNIEVEGISTRRGRSNFNSFINNVNANKNAKQKRKIIVIIINLGLEGQLYNLRRRRRADLL